MRLNPPKHVNLDASLLVACTFEVRYAIVGNYPSASRIFAAGEGFGLAVVHNIVTFCTDFSLIAIMPYQPLVQHAQEFLLHTNQDRVQC